MSLRQHPTKGQGFWQIRYQIAGTDKYVTFQGTRADAEALETSLRRQARPVLSAVPTLAQAAPDFLAAYETEHQPRGVERTRLSLRWLLEFFGKYLFSHISPELIELYKQQRLAKGVGRSTINKELAALSAFCRWAADRGYCQRPQIKRFPARLTRAPLPDVPTRGECLALINSAAWPVCGIFACLYLAGLRLSEALHLRVEHVWLQKRLIFVAAGKGNKQGVVPISETLRPVLERRIAELDGARGYLWAHPDGQPYRSIRTAFATAAKRAGIERRMYPHLLRHAYGLHATEAGVGLRALQQAMRHSSASVTEIYSHLQAESLIRELDKFK